MRSALTKPWFWLFTCFVSISAYGGAIGLVGGGADLGPTLNHRLPLHSPVLGGLALALIVGVPSSIVTVWARRRDPRTAPALIVAGVLLIGWIAVQLAFIRTFAFLQVVYVAVGIAYIAIGRQSGDASPGVDVGALPSRSGRS